MLKCIFRAIVRKNHFQTELFALDLFLKIILMLKKKINPDNYLNNKTNVSWLIVS